MFKKLTILSISTLVIIGTLYSPVFSKPVHAQATLTPEGFCPAGSTGPQGGPCTCTPPNVPATLGTGGTICTTQDIKTNIDAAQNSTWMTDAIIASVSKVLDTIMGVVFRIVAFFLWLAGNMFDYILTYTIVNMSEHIGNTSGIGKAIGEAWKTLRDLANMAFIFVLIWAAIQSMLDLDTAKYKSQIKNIIIVALLINFSLFFTQIVIDAGNIATIGFYNAIMANSTSFSGIFMKALGIQSFSGADILQWFKDGSTASSLSLITHLLGSVTMIILMVVLVIATVMFIARFIVLVFILVLSPLAFIGYAVPGMKKYFDQWRTALVDQSFFPLYFMLLMWVAIKIMASPNFINTGGKQFSTVAALPNQDAIGLFIKFSLIIGFIIGALIISKKAATSTAGFTMVSGAVIAGGAYAGRKSFGQIGKKVSESAGLQESANRKRETVKDGFKTGGWKGAVSAVGGKVAGATARAALYTSNTARSSTFDIRNATVPTNVVGDLVEGTLGRTSLGKRLGLNDVNIPAVAVGSYLAGSDLGKAETKGYKELDAEKKKRIQDKDTAVASEFRQSQAKSAVIDGSKDTASPKQIEAMEKALAKLSDKETEALLASNRDLLKSQNVANAISVRQLEAINKSDQFSDGEKDAIKGARFKTINDGMAAMAVPVASRTAAHIAAIKALPNGVRDLSDSELEMIESTHLTDPNFVEQLRPSQIEAINKSNKFTTTQKESIKEARFSSINKAMAPGGVMTSAAKAAIKSLSDPEIEMMSPDYLNQDKFVSELRTSQVEAINKSNKFTAAQKDRVKTIRRAPLEAALLSGSVSNSQTTLQNMGPKEIAALDIGTLTDPLLVGSGMSDSGYTPNMLKRMGQEMNTANIQALRKKLIASLDPKHPTREWLEHAQTGVVDFS